MASRLDEVVRDLTVLLDVAVPPGLSQIRPRLLRQADQHTDRFVQLFHRPDF
jgi:hypothetical protein